MYCIIQIYNSYVFIEYEKYFKLNEKVTNVGNVRMWSVHL